MTGSRERSRGGTNGGLVGGFLDFRIEFKKMVMSYVLIWSQHVARVPC